MSAAVLRLLVVDDDAVDRRAVRRALSDGGMSCEVIEAQDASGALEHLRQGSFDCIFLDYYLPGSTGMEVIADARAAGVDTPIVVLTGRGDEETAVELMKAGATDYLPKGTLTPERLAQSLRYALRVSRAERQARRAEAALRQAVRDREEVLAVVSHDLRSPLHTILLTASGLLDRTLPGSEEHRQMERIRRVAEQMEHLLEDLLDVAQIEAGKLQIERSPIDVPGLLDEVCESFHPQAEGKSVELDCAVPGIFPVLDADRRRLIQVLSNLLGNALRLSPEGGRVEVKAEPVDRALRFSVRDDGPGIASEDLPRIFDRFWQAAPGRRRGGAGLGLTIARGIVEAHGGRIWADSVPGRGSVFYFTIPTPGGPIVPSAQGGAAAGRLSAAAG